MKTSNYYVRWHYLPKRKIVCDIFDENKNLMSTGETACWHKDTFNKDMGRKISLTRALIAHNDEGKIIHADLERKETISSFSKEERTEIWEAYRTMTKKVKWGETPEGHEKKFNEGKKEPLLKQ